MVEEETKMLCRNVEKPTNELVVVVLQLLLGVETVAIVLLVLLWHLLLLCNLISGSLKRHVCSRRVLRDN